jgi:uncharacterized membrane protein YccC
MRLKANKTISRQQLAVKLREEKMQNTGFFTWERRRLLIHAAKTALAAALCWWIAMLFGLHDGYWGAISAIIVLQSNFGATISASRDRILGTLIGAVLGFAFTLVGALPWNFILAVLAAVIVCGVLGLRSSSRLAGVTISIIMLVNTGSHWTLALHRVLEVFLGIFVAVAISTLVLPDSARLRLRDGLAKEFLLLGAFFEGIFEGFRGSPVQNLPALREDVLKQMRGNNQLMEAARHEPSGGPGWREGLGMLSQFGRSQFDALIALELAVKDSHEDGYAQQLEPALGRLAIDIRAGFHYIAECTYAWRFHIPPPGLHLDEDIAQLEARMAEVRPTGFQFTQAEILRAYAVQLHLKQIARMLRASRVETSRAIGEAQK